MAETKKLPIGFPLGVKINEDELINGLTIDELIKITKTYHNDRYVVGYDTLYCEKPHYHIHFFSCKETSVGALKTFRTTNLKKKYPHISKAFRLYAGQDLPSANPENWLSYCIKETTFKVNNIEVSDSMIIEAKTHLEVKKLKKVHSEKKKVIENEKKDFKEKMFDYVKQNIQDYQDKENEYYGREQDAFFVSVIDYLETLGKYGSMKMFLLRQYYLEYKSKHSQERWTAKDILLYINR